MINSYIYTFVREDISPEQKIVQIGHACHEAGKMLGNEESVSSMVLLSAKDETDLMSISEKLDLMGIEHYMFHEPDDDMGYSAICTIPITSKNDRSFFKRWSLYRHTA